MQVTMETSQRIASELAEFAERVADRAIGNRTELDGLGAAFLARGCQSLMSVAALASQGLIGDAMSVMRTIVELDIDLAYISKRSTDRMKLFFDFEAISNFKLAKAIDKLHGGNVDQGAMALLKARSDAAWVNNPNAREWAPGITIGARATDTGRDHAY